MLIKMIRTGNLNLTVIYKCKTYEPFPQIVALSSMKYWSSLTVLLSPLTTTFHSACAFPRKTTRTAEINEIFSYYSL